MIIYELAKELKEAGFPFIEFNASIHGTDRFNPDLESETGYLAIPTLAELIKECKGGFGKLCYYEYADNEDLENMKWCVYSNEVASGIQGSTPEEAVARLWLALNKK